MEALGTPPLWLERHFSTMTGRGRPLSDALSLGVLVAEGLQMLGRRGGRLVLVRRHL